MRIILYPGFRLLAVILAVVLTITLVVPARAEAIEPLAIVGLATLAVVVVILVVYLIVANRSDSRQSQDGERRYLACVESDTEARTCWVLPQGEALPTVPVIPQS